MDKFAGCILGRIVFAPWRQERDEIKFAYLPPIARIFVALKTSKSDKPSLVKLAIYATPTGLNSTEFKCKRDSQKLKTIAISPTTRVMRRKNRTKKQKWNKQTERERLRYDVAIFGSCRSILKKKTAKPKSFWAIFMRVKAILRDGKNRSHSAVLPH